MTPRTILHVYKDFAPHQGGGGVARHIDGLAVVSAALGYQLRVAATQAEAAAPDDPYVVLRTRLPELWREVGRAHIVHVHGARTPVAAVAMLMARLRRRHVVYTPHCYYDLPASAARRGIKWLWDALVERALLRGSDAVVLLSAYWLEYLQQRGLTPRRPVLLPNCVLQARMGPPAAPAALAGQPALLSVGRLDAVKRLEDAIAALAQPGLEHAVLHLVGRGPDQPRLEAVAKRLGVASRVSFHGFVDDAGVAAMARRADVFVMSSAAEGLPTVLIEMLLQGCPVVASDIPGNRPILEAAQLDGLYPLGDVPALARAIRRLSGAPLPPEVQPRVCAAFTWEGLAARIHTLYEGLDDASAGDAR